MMENHRRTPVSTAESAGRDGRDRHNASGVAGDRSDELDQTRLNSIDSTSPLNLAADQEHSRAPSTRLPSTVYPDTLDTLPEFLVPGLYRPRRIKVQLPIHPLVQSTAESQPRLSSHAIGPTASTSTLPPPVSHSHAIVQRPQLSSPAASLSNSTSRPSTTKRGAGVLRDVVDLTRSDSDDDMVVCREIVPASISYRTSGGKTRRTKGEMERRSAEVEEAKVRRRTGKQKERSDISSEQPKRRSSKSIVDSRAANSKPKKLKKPPTLAELIAARKKSKAGERVSFSTVDGALRSLLRPLHDVAVLLTLTESVSAEYKVYLKDAPTTSSNLVFSSSRVVLLNFAPDLNASLHPDVMNWIDLVATKGGHLVPAREFVAPPRDFELGDDWSRGTAGDKSILERAEREGWTTHIVIITPSFASSANPPPATFEAVLARLGRDGLTMNSLGKFVKIVQTTWLSGSGAEVVPCSELGHELFLEERRSGGATEPVDREVMEVEKRWRKQLEMARLLEIESRDGEEDSADEEEDAPYVFRFFSLLSI